MCLRTDKIPVILELVNSRCVPFYNKLNKKVAFIYVMWIFVQITLNILATGNFYLFEIISSFKIVKKICLRPFLRFFLTACSTALGSTLSDFPEKNKKLLRVQPRQGRPCRIFLKKIRNNYCVFDRARVYLVGFS